ncbi:hypothetical protein Tsubulata_041209 [Turnera subulata]|uniref:Major facilitator superfamily (MFS) profile domain-containing protein n=1 Tax=Turnera subulata TaxID=218843 RepID=A0A9Q0JPD0_9ROSI|nr:hypothetical protein Tsubulata_041209 [Turnera subulata]
MPTIYFSIPGAAKPGTLPPNVAAAVNGLSFGHSAKGVMATLCFFRFWLGFGIGGDYPLSATIMSEYANKRTRGAFIAAVFAMQGFGILAAGIVGLVVSSAFNHAYEAPAYEVDPAASTVSQTDYVWRIILMFGALPAILTYYWRMKMLATRLLLRRMQNRQLQTCLRAQTLIALCGTVPGYWFTVALIDYLGQFTIQLMGFFFMTVFMFALAIPYHHWTLKARRVGFLVMYSLTFFFANFGPNATTFVVPAEIFPARLRST